MVEKRAHPGGGGMENGSKRMKPANAPPPKASVADAIARAKARAQELNLKRGMQTTATPASSAPPAPRPDVSATTGVAALQAQLDALKKKQQAAAAPPPPPPSEPLSGVAALQARMAAIKANQAATANKERTAPSTYPASKERDYERDSGRAPYDHVTPPEEPEPSMLRGGLSIGLHPALMGNDTTDNNSKNRSMAPKFATVMANRRTESPAPKKQLDLSGPDLEEYKQNPYYDPRLSTMAGRDRSKRTLVFNSKGKYVERANMLRSQARLEMLRQELAKAARKAGVDENSERGFLVHQPPDVEWWDEGLLEEKTYDCIDNPAKLKISGDDSIISSYVQHPVLLKPPQEQRLIQLKPLPLTSKQQAKARRIRRAEELKEIQAKIRLGLEPPPPPKVKRGNMMRVMGEQAIADPTAVEMLVENQIRERAEKHEKANEERKLTKEQRHAKLAQQQETDAQKGLYMLVFKVDKLVYGKHRYQVDINAKQNVLTGVTILNPKLNVIVVEGGWHSIVNYKKLMLHRVKWTENGAPSLNGREPKGDPEPEWLRPIDEEGRIKDLSSNKCTLIFEGEIKDRAFRRWQTRICETDGDARELLGKSKLDSLWALAQGTE